MATRDQREISLEDPVGYNIDWLRFVWLISALIVALKASSHLDPDPRTGKEIPPFIPDQSDAFGLIRRHQTKILAISDESDFTRQIRPFASLS